MELNGITQQTLRTIIKKRASVEQLQQQLKLAQSRLASMEYDVIKALQKSKAPKCPLKNGKLFAFVKVDYRACVSWKAVLQGIKGAKFVENILAKAPRKENVSLVIEQSE